MNFVDNFNFYGVEAKEIPCIKGEGSPTTETESAVGLLYMNTENGDLYKCISAVDGVFVWDRVSNSSDEFQKEPSRNLMTLTFQNATCSAGRFVVRSSNDVASSPEYISVVGGENYTFSSAKSAVRSLIYVHEYTAKDEGAYIKTTGIGSLNDKTSATIQLDETCAYIRIHFFTLTPSDSWKDLIPEKFQLELGEAPTEYVKPSVISLTEIDEVQLAEKMKKSRAIFPDETIVAKVPQTEILSGDLWEEGALSNTDGSETVAPAGSRFRTKGYIQLRKGDVISDPKGMLDVFEYDTITLEYLGGADGWQSAYTVQNDCVARFLVGYNNSSYNVDNRITITRNTRDRVLVCGLPLSEIEYLIKRVATEKVSNDTVSKTKFCGIRNKVLKQIAHRGYVATGAPQCTAPAYILAKQFGFDYGENDMWVTSDGVFVMAHNTTMPSDNTTVIADNTYETLLTCNMGTFNGKTIPIMTLEEWLIVMKKIGMEAYIDLKSALTAEQATEAVAIVRKHGMLDKVTWSGNNEATMRNIRTAHPTARLALLNFTTMRENFADMVIADKPDLTVFYTQSTRVTAEVIENARNAGVGIEVWHCDYSSNGFTTEEAILAEVDRVVELGVSGICLDTYLPAEHFINSLNDEWDI